MIYQIYFLVFLVTLLVTIELVSLFKKGYRIKFEDKHFHIENIQKGVRYVAQKIINVGANTPEFLTQSKGNKELYDSLKRDFPGFDVEALKNKIRSYILNYLKNNQDSNDIKKTKSFTNDISNLTSDKAIDKKSLMILRTLLDKYTHDGGLAKIQFNTELEYNRNYENGVPRKVQENYITEFVHAYTDLKKTQKIKCPVCGNDVTIVNKNIKCTHCNEVFGDDIWYLNKIRKI